MPRSLTSHIDTPQALGRRLREAREAAGLSQRKLAFPGCTAAYISRLEAGARVPSLQMVNELATRTNVRADWLARGADLSTDGMTDETRVLVQRLTLRVTELERALIGIGALAASVTGSFNGLATVLRSSE